LIPLVAVVGVGIAMFIAALLLLWYADAENEDYAAVFAAFGAGLAGAGGAVLAVYRQAQIDERKARQAREAFRRVLWSEASIAIHCLVQVAGVLHQVVTIFANRGEISGVLYEIRPSVIFTGSVARYPELDPDDIIALLFLNQAIEVYMRERAEFVLVSFDVARDTPSSLAQYRAERSLGAQWTLLHGDGDGIRELAALLGVKYRQESDGAFSHSNVITVLNPQGEITYQRVGLNGGVDEAASALVAASK